ncbi:uncharacterized protein LOC143027476 [Oratosquilla oratoria]|uniref:uncharacterized protein LOC143027476 n=1 Tax=Oratosquilla oratoria TaxID=337810 RepID=UPI003F76FBCF
MTGQSQTMGAMWLVFLLQGVICEDVDLIRLLHIPRYTFVGDSVNISCFYEPVKETGLYSLKWYHNNIEFYRYVPYDEHRPVNYKHTSSFNVDEVSRALDQVTLKLSHLTVDAAGNYTCEVIAEQPSFRTDAVAKCMSVFGEPLLPPTVEGIKEFYELTDLVSLTCRPQNYPSSMPDPAIGWYIQGEPVHHQFLSDGDKRSLLMQIPAKKISRTDGPVEVACSLALGTQDRRTFRKLTIRTPTSYIYNYFSSGPSLRSKRWTYLLVSIFVFVYVGQV